ENKAKGKIRKIQEDKAKYLRLFSKVECQGYELVEKVLLTPLKRVELFMTVMRDNVD
ncbi:unnamed protein product, partial [Amoebophrya sp. A25]